jgi:nicotinamide-nucleotide amidase
MATLPENAAPIPNPVGTAPGVRAALKQTTLIALPGVPSEMKAIFHETAAPLLKKASGKNVFYGKKNIYVDCVMESSLAPLIDKVMQDNRGVYVKSHPKGREDMPHMEVHLSTTTDDSEVAEERLRRAVVQLSGLVGEIGGKVIV